MLGGGRLGCTLSGFLGSLLRGALLSCRLLRSLLSRALLSCRLFGGGLLRGLLSGSLVEARSWTNEGLDLGFLMIGVGWLRVLRRGAQVAGLAAARPER